MSSSVVVVDYGVGNLVSVARAFEKVGASVVVSGDAEVVAAADRLVLPGVGAFGHCMDEIRRRNLVDSILNFSRSGRPFLGICVGMQVMFEVSEEFGEQAGLGLMKGRVARIKATAPSGPSLKLPVIGWHRPVWTAKWPGDSTARARGDGIFYFVHSFAAKPDDENIVLSTYPYGTENVTAAIGSGPMVGTQFHPEKSGEDGLRFLATFMSF